MFSSEEEAAAITAVVVVATLFDEIISSDDKVAEENDDTTATSAHPDRKVALCLQAVPLVLLEFSNEEMLLFSLLSFEMILT